LPEYRDIVLLISVFGAHEGNRIEGRTRIQKEICLLKYGSHLPFTFGYRPYYYGPYSEELSETLNTLVGVRLLKETITPVGFNSFRYDYALTEQGRRLLDRFPDDFAEPISRISEEVRQFEALETPALVALAKRISGIESVS
jgi:uncharacterized protein YwgA